MSNLSYLEQSKERFFIAYHRSDAKFSEFEKGDIGFHFGTREQADNRGGKYLYKAEIRLNKPAMVHDIGEWDNPSRVLDGLYEAGIISYEEEESIRNLHSFKDISGRFKALRQLLQNKGFDGIEYQNEHEGEGTSYIVFDKNNVKLIRR